MLGPMRRVFTALAKTLLHILGVAIPLLGFWIASSIAAYLNGPIWLVLLCGLLVCPVLPALFEIWRAFQRKKYQERPSYGGAIAYSAYVDASRVATVLLVGALVIDAKGVAAAVSTRGDWMLEGTAGSVVERARQSLLWVADRITAIGESNEDNPYAQFDDSEKTDPGERGWRYEPPTPEPEKPRRRAKRRSKKQSKKSTQRRRPDAGFWDSGLPPIPREVTRRGDRRRPLDIPQPRLRPDAGSPDSGVRRRTDDIPEIVIHEEPPPKPKRRRIARPERYAYWLVSASPHRVVRSMPASAKSSWRSVASHIAKLESDPFERVKAIHDFIATEIGYEANFDINNLPPSDPDAVFQRGWAVCSGYARLFKAMVEHTGGEAVYISGRSRFAVQHGVEMVELPALFEASDVITIHVPLDGTTRDLVGSDLLGRAKPGAVLVNLARGGIVNEAAVLQALDDGPLAAAAFDVFATEPPRALSLVGHPRVIATPHIGGSSAEAILGMGRAAIAGLQSARLISEIDFHEVP